MKLDLVKDDSDLGVAHIHEITEVEVVTAKEDRDRCLPAITCMVEKISKEEVIDSVKVEASVTFPTL